MALGHAGMAASFAAGIRVGGTSRDVGASPAGSSSVASGCAMGSLLLFIFAWNVSWAGLMLTVACELMPAHIRGRGSGAVYCLYWLLSFIITQTLETTFDLLGLALTFALYSVSTAGAFWFAWACVPETRAAPLPSGE